MMTTEVIIYTLAFPLLMLLRWLLVNQSQWLIRSQKSGTILIVLKELFVFVGQCCKQNHRFSIHESLQVISVAVLTLILGLLLVDHRSIMPNDITALLFVILVVSITAEWCFPSKNFENIELNIAPLAWWSLTLGGILWCEVYWGGWSLWAMPLVLPYLWPLINHEEKSLIDNWIATLQMAIIATLLALYMVVFGPEEFKGLHVLFCYLLLSFAWRIFGGRYLLKRLGCGRWSVVVILLYLTFKSLESFYAIARIGH